MKPNPTYLHCKVHRWPHLPPKLHRFKQNTDDVADLVYISEITSHPRARKHIARLHRTVTHAVYSPPYGNGWHGQRRIRKLEPRIRKPGFGNWNGSDSETSSVPTVCNFTRTSDQLQRNECQHHPTHPTPPHPTPPVATVCNFAGTSTSPDESTSF